MSSNPNEKSKIYRIACLSEVRTPELLEYLKFFKYTVALLESELLNQLGLDEASSFAAGLQEANIQLVIGVSKEGLAREVLTEKIRSLNSEINLKLKNFDSSISLPSSMKIAWITFILDETSKVGDLLNSPSLPKEAPVFFEFSKRTESAGHLETIKFSQNNYEFISAYGDLSYIYSLENPDDRIGESLLLSAKEENFKSATNPSNTIVSIIIPCFNRSKYLPSVLEALDAQLNSSSAFEVLVVDDGSNDGTLSVISNWFKERPRNFTLRCFSPPRSHTGNSFINRVGAIRNLGAIRACGKYLLFLDSDILLPPGFLERLMSQQLEDCVLQPYRHNLTVTETDGWIAGQGDFKKISFSSQDKDFVLSYLENQSMTSDYVQWCASYCWFMSKENFRDIGGFRNCFITYGWEDVDFAFRLRKSGKRIIPNEQICYHLHTLSDSSEYTNENFNRRIKLLPGAELFFRNTLSLRSMKCFVFGLFRSLVTYRKYSEYSDTKGENSVLQNASLDDVIALGKVVLPGVSFDHAYLNKVDFSSEERIIKALKDLDRSVNQMLILGSSICRLPTRILMDKDLNIQTVRRVLKNPNAYETDNFINFLFLVGWKFKSGQNVGFKIDDSSIGLTLVNDQGQSVSTSFNFDIVFIEDIFFAEKINFSRLKSKTIVFCHLELKFVDSLLKKFMDENLVVQKIEEYEDRALLVCQKT